MDKYLFEQYILELEDETLDDLYKYIITSAQNKIENSDKRYITTTHKKKDKYNS